MEDAQAQLPKEPIPWTLLNRPRQIQCSPAHANSSFATRHFPLPAFPFLLPRSAVSLSCAPSMKSSVLHIVLALLLLLSYGAERLLPCSGSWDLDCVGAECAEAVEAEFTTVQCSPVETHADSCSEYSGSTHDSDAPADHGDHQCNCPCHAAAITAVPATTTYAAGHTAQQGAYSRGLLHTTLSPPDHIPIG